MRNRASKARMIVGGAVVALCARGACATSVQDLVRIQGKGRVILQGMGIVVGLPGTGDSSKDSYVAARPFGRLLENLGNPVASLAELQKSDAFAIVFVRMEVPPEGVRDGDRLNVSVDKLFDAESLVGGRLVVSLLRMPGPDSPDLLPMAFAEGPLVVDPENPGSGMIRDGGQMLSDIRTDPVTAAGTMTLVLKSQYAGYPVATTIANAIDDEFAIDGYSSITTVEDAKNIRIQIPEADRRSPAQFIATLMTVPIDPSLIRTEARIVINERAGIITITGDVQVGPVAITHRGMQLSNIAAPNPAAAAIPGLNPAAGGAGTPGTPGAPVMPRRWVGVDTTDGSGPRSTRLSELLAALDQLSVPTADQIAIIYELRDTGALHGKVITQ